MDSSKIHSLGCDLSDNRIRGVLSHITKLKSLAFPVVCLPDLHMKERTEGPCSFAAATQNTIVPELTAPSVGCGMGALITSISKETITEQFLERFYSSMQTELGPNYGKIKNMLNWFGLIERPKMHYDLSVRDFIEIIKHGAKTAVAIYGLPADFLKQVEYEGGLFTKKELAGLNLKKILPRVSYRSGRHNIGYGFKGNHFLEIQYIEELLDEKLAKAWGLEKNRIVIMYHGGGGAVSYHIGRYFGNRKKNTASQKLYLLAFKALFHFGSPLEWKYAPKRLRYYFFSSRFMEIPANSPEGKRLLMATKASLNYSYGFRMAIIKRIIDSLGKAAPATPTVSLIWDGAHNAITEEIVSGKNVIVHRHTANRVFDKKPLIISGFNNTNSYIAVGMQNAERHLFSSDHGAGTTIKKMMEKNNTTTHPKKYKTVIYQSHPPFQKIVNHITNEGVDYVVQQLENAGIARPVVKLRPIAVFKG
ncbi:MAG: hypothetical protein A3C80_00395 [Candidatus Ryanbacteria bacterium RIFCSPHIGHO2_02_FULL_45_43]|uniref:tRNA-splicing ligase RtcB n=1 Tax=Candidatus Ryanbacteria bacterium RIFCSPHIGHO2_01_45_13 TaxID=1802112 RepID=A0A1G2FXC9_9BACT|nr:MAG: hypothetical protein A2718_01785 [Candidatus Ryanbacteria bacterium RIFCSPHIGHO2_01_FULL_44_130]OGZ42736.1 MAG: hypothetical protein A2W41_03280 [Candidatus Ryanbacteria bacterium RIFCSPHIGHO2_01_45_13]OGZ48776.1 MAG: hypothetical protein A3C80_00395 [Candidatus Ryanbacteria bacterium RIFCSPHIGHO2_02_FULL_45_43]OGZ50808.1 MAG: hypothetical protein A3E55_02415 [Candidatus Ryanbacteria bacterium RIFCSPHIGHO2_12_FULL_44_20]OGZ52019.1 MAG: hypothetical protein A3A17_01000 [Candidatus Ryanba